MRTDEQGNTWVRQSWLDTVFRCPERGRYAVIKPEWDSQTSDSAAIGTLAHAEIEWTLNKMANPYGVGALADAIDAAWEKIQAESPNGLKFTKYGTIGEVFEQARQCADAWRIGILPELERLGHLGGRTEVPFQFVLYRRPDGTTVGIEGTIDYVPPVTTDLWDWKTAAREYKQRDKQRFAIQPTAYCAAAVNGGLGSDDYDWPLQFHYGVLVRGAKAAKAQIVTVQRTEEHLAWATHRIRTFVELATVYGFDKPWPQIDENNYLCSQTWCPWHSICRGAEITASHDSWRP